LALNEEIKSLLDLNTFSLTSVDPLSVPKESIIPSRIIFDIRRNADGSINKFLTNSIASNPSYANDTTKSDPNTNCNLRFVNLKFTICL
jgi:hypothetical protein